MRTGLFYNITKSSVISLRKLNAFFTFICYYRCIFYGGFIHHEQPSRPKSARLCGVCDGNHHCGGSHCRACICSWWCHRGLIQQHHRNCLSLKKEAELLDLFFHLINSFFLWLDKPVPGLYPDPLRLFHRPGPVSASRRRCHQYGLRFP